jgi:hypothetical protein
MSLADVRLTTAEKIGIREALSAASVRTGVRLEANQLVRLAHRSIGKGGDI